MENKKFSMLNTAKKDTTTHETLQQEILNKRGGRPKKDESSKLKHVVSLNVNEREKEILESEANAIGLNVVSLIRMSLSNALKSDFTPLSITSICSTEFKKTKVIKQYAVPVTKAVKEQLDERASEYMISISELLKMSLRMSGYYNI